MNDIRQHPCFGPYETFTDVLARQVNELEGENAILRTALNEKVQHHLEEHPTCGKLPSERQAALYERDQRLNEIPASYTFHDPMRSLPEKEEQK